MQDELKAIRGSRISGINRHILGVIGLDIFMSLAFEQLVKNNPVAPETLYKLGNREQMHSAVKGLVALGIAEFQCEDREPEVALTAFGRELASNVGAVISSIGTQVRFENTLRHMADYDFMPKHAKELRRASDALGWERLVPSKRKPQAPSALDAAAAREALPYSYAAPKPAEAKVWADGLLKDEITSGGPQPAGYFRQRANGTWTQIEESEVGDFKSMGFTVKTLYLKG